MPRGQPDFGLYTATPVASGISDPGEAAARLGGINIYDRRGWTVWMDDFESPSLNWFATFGVPGEKPVLSTAQKWMGAQSVYFSCPAGAAPESTLYRYFPLIKQGKFGIEFWLSGYTLTTAYFFLGLDIYDGVDNILAEMKIDLETNIISINTAAGWKAVATGSFETAITPLFIPVKLVVDMDTNKYVRLLVGATEFDISTHSMIDFGDTTKEYFQCLFRLYGDADGDMYAWLDNFILTQNEP